MSGMQFLRLEDAQEDSPQARTLLNLFEQDALFMVKYVSQVETAFQGLINAQKKVAECTQALSQKLLDFEKWSVKFPLGRDESILVSTLQQFAVTLEKVTSMHGFLTKELSTCIAPLQEFANTDHMNIQNQRGFCHAAEQDHDAALSKYGRVSKRKELDTKASIEANDDLYKSRKKLQKLMLERYLNLNMLQYKRSVCLLEPLVGALNSFRKFQNMGNQVHSKESGEYIGDICASVQSVKFEMSKFAEKSANKISEIEQNSIYYYVPEPTLDLRMPAKPVNRTLNQKGSYLWNRSKSGLGHRWDRKYFFTQGSILMSQERNEIAGGLVVDLENSIVQPVDVDDRRFVFQINDTVDPKRVITLQAMSNSEREEWIYTIRNINTGYSHQEKQKRPSLPLLKISQSQVLTSSQGGPTPTRETQKGEGHRGKHHSGNKVPPTPPSSPLETILPDTPIQFDLSSLNEAAAKVEPAGSPKDGPPKRINPFSQSSTQIRAEQNQANIPGYLQMFQVRFLGSMEVQTDQGPQVVMETTRHIMTARAIHNIFKTTESNLIITTEDLRLQDLSSQAIKAVFPLRDISFWMVHQENKRWFAFISHSQGGIRDNPTFICYVFETDTAAQEICNSFNVAAEIAFKVLIQQKSSDKTAAMPTQEFPSTGAVGPASSIPPELAPSTDVYALPGPGGAATGASNVNPQILPLSSLSLNSHQQLQHTLPEQNSSSPSSFTYGHSTPS